MFDEYLIFLYFVLQIISVKVDDKNKFDAYDCLWLKQMIT